jgi:hypothetical protein
MSISIFMAERSLIAFAGIRRSVRHASLPGEGCRFGDGHGLPRGHVRPVGVVVMAWIASVC